MDLSDMGFKECSMCDDFVSVISDSFEHLNSTGRVFKMVFGCLPLVFLCSIWGIVDSLFDLMAFSIWCYDALAPVPWRSLYLVATVLSTALLVFLLCLNGTLSMLESV